MDVVSAAAEGEAGGVSVPDSTHDVHRRPVVLAAGGREGDGAEPRIRWLGGVGLWAAGAVVAGGVVAAASAWTVMDSVDTSHDPLWVSPVTVTRDANDDRPSGHPPTTRATMPTTLRSAIERRCERPLQPGSDRRLR